MIALYARVSTQEQANEGYSIDEQVERLKLYCKAHGRTDYKVYIDAGYSGAKLDRAGLQNMISDAKAGKLDKVIVYKLDRLSRSQKDTLWLIEDAFMAHGVDFESMTERFDTGTSFGRAMVGILAVFAQLEREQIKERMKLGKQGRARSGKYYCSGRQPTGYDIKDKALYINEYEAMQVREAFERYASGESLRKIAADFAVKGYTTKHGQLTANTLYHILDNPLYKGIIRSGGDEYAGIHEPIVSDELFEAVQKRRQRRSGGSGKSYTAEHMLLGGLCWCKRCGERYGAFITNGGRYRYYSCYAVRGMITGKSCDNVHYRADKLESIIIHEIQRLELDRGYIKRIQSDTGTHADTDARVRSLRRQLEKVQRQSERLIDLYSMDGIDKDTLSARISAQNGQRAQLEAQLQELELKKPKISEYQAMQAVQGFGDVVACGTHTEIKLIIKELIDHIEIDGEDVFIHWNFV